MTSTLKEKEELRKFFISEAISQMKTLNMPKKEKVYLATQLLSELQTLLTTGEILDLLDSKEIKWHRMQERFLVWLVFSRCHVGIG